MAPTELSFYDRISDALANPDGQLAIAAGAKAKYDNRARAMSEFPSMEITRDRARSIRAHTPVSYTHLRAHETRHDLV